MQEDADIQLTKSISTKDLLLLNSQTLEEQSFPWQNLERNEGILRQALLSPDKDLKDDVIFTPEDKQQRLRPEILLSNQPTTEKSMKKHQDDDRNGVFSFDAEVNIEANGNLVPDGSEYTAHLLSQLSSCVLPTMSSSQVSSVLSALEPSSQFEIKASQSGKERSPTTILSEFLKIDPRQEKTEVKKHQPKIIVNCFEVGDKYSWFKCTFCNFISLRRETVIVHYRLVHSDSDIAIDLKCIACSSNFKCLKLLKSHYVYDHHASLNEINEMVKLTIEINKCWKEEKKEITGVQETVKEKEIEGSKIEDKKKVENIQPLIITKINDKSPLTKCGIDGCSVKFVSEANMIYHKQCHSTGSEWKCPECLSQFNSWQILINHLWKTHSIDLELYSCDECSYKTNSLSKLLNLHRRIHRDERPFLCDTCGKGFKTKKQLRNHKIIHRSKDCTTPKVTVDCRLCSRRFHDTKLLNYHMDSVHKGLRPYLCSICGHTAASRSSLKMHVRSHTGEKPYRCTECDYSTSDHNSLRRHKMRHTGAKYYKCPHCPYACIQSTTYKTHLNNKHPGMDAGLMFSCTLCPFKTVKKENFLAHTSYHSINNEQKEEDKEIPQTELNVDIQQEFTLHELEDDTSSPSQATHHPGRHFLVPATGLVKAEVLINDRMLSESQVAEDTITDTTT